MTRHFPSDNHTKMTQGLRAVSDAFQFALDTYLAACSSLSIDNGFIPFEVSLEIAHNITRELRLFDSYEEKIRQARAAILAANDSLFPIVPISSLPDEIMLRIFHLIRGMESYAFETEVDAERLPENSFAISQVCARWRRIALDSRRLWSRVDLSSSPVLYEKLLARGRILASRADGIALDIRIVEPFVQSWNDGDDISHSLYLFLASVGRCVGSLELAFSIEWFNCGIHRMLDYCFKKCIPGKLSELTVQFRQTIHRYGPFSLRSSSGDGFLYPRDQKIVNDQGHQRPISLTNSELDDILSPVTVLKLDKVYPYWSSKAYHGLVELHLISWEHAPESIQITEQQLAEIFRSSPALKILHFGIEITPASVACPPVELGDLEELHIRVDSMRSQQAILRLLVPGSKPMQMYMEYRSSRADRKLPSSTTDEFQRFLGRSNVTQFHLDADYLLLRLPTLLQLLPNLEMLILRYVTLDTIDYSLALDGALGYQKLHTIHFHFGIIQLDAFRWLSDKNNLGLKRMTITGSVIRVAERVQPYPLKEYADVLQSIFPALNIIDSPED